MTTSQDNEVSGRLWTVSNGFSMLRMLMAVPVAFLLFQTPVPRGTVFILCWIAYATDLLDGWIARRFGQESNIGRVIDPLADKVYIAGMVLAMLVLGMIPVWFVVLVLVRDVTIFFAGIYLRKRTGVLVQSNYTGKAAVVTIGFTLLMALYRADVSDAVFAGMLALSVAMQAASLIGYGKRFHSLITTSRND